MHRRANLTKSRELLLVARNAREHSREKDALRLRLQAALEKNELVEEDLKTEKQRVRLAEQRTRLAEDETRIVKEELTKFKASTTKALQERELSLQEMSHSVSGKAEYTEQQLARLQAELATAKAEKLSAVEEKESAARELEKIRTIEEQTSGVAADLMQRCNTLRSQLSAAERHSETLEKELNDALGGNNAEIANGALENLEQLLEEAASAPSGALAALCPHKD
ncbi:hypothetical protein CYMTET_36215 [Cymbomonas tetramitiformis]|uniref:Uncharacterized protein n=1 Tax=Cymbomonas tetramitiformis TaxID=36881 RepID=A0AAE0F7N4_9CHLO|nr:hypothetical protein CYMTET_36215 [Cymbomonas tetramitiformis]